MMMEDFIDALQQITECKGAFNRDPVIHIQNCLRDMQAVAINVLRKYGLEPRRQDDPIDGELVPVKEFEKTGE